ncbi:hypothetical protein [Actinoplanes sp. CA-252034]|uniref:hypothetical protein n=1 Tax=Actinoplanes sp. CA-252034 TaxID=3239906 RepID=UPI003D99FCC1
MTTEQHPQQNEPNEFGFAGEGTGPEPGRQESTDVDAEAVAVPADDLTGPLTRTLEEATGRDEG